jgi:hypothetical protein
MSKAQILALRDALEQAHRALTEDDMSDTERESIAAFVQLQWLLLDRSLQVAA